LYKKELEDFFQRGGILAWGLIPSVEESLQAETLPSLMKRFENILQHFTRKGFGQEELLASSLLTTSCGLATLNLELAEKALLLNRELASELRTRYSLKEKN
jgi:hypothetical protein